MTTRGKIRGKKGRSGNKKREEKKGGMVGEVRGRGVGEAGVGVSGVGGGGDQ